MTHAKCGLLADADMISTCLQRMSCNGIIDQLIPFLLRLMRVISQLTMINDKTLIAVLAAIHLLSAVGLASFDQDRMMYATLRAVFENIFVNGEIHDKERRDHVLDLINLERLKQLKQFFGSRFSTDSIETDVLDIYSSISPRLKSRGHKYFINKSHMLSFVLQFKRGGTLQSTWR